MNNINLHLLSFSWCVFVIIAGCSQATPLALAINQPSTESEVEEDPLETIEIWLLEKPGKMVGATWDPRMMDEFGGGFHGNDLPHQLIIHLPNRKTIEMKAETSSFLIRDQIVRAVGIAPTETFEMTFDEAVKFARKFLAHFNVPPTSNMHNQIKMLERQVHAGADFLPFHFGVELDIYPNFMAFIRIAQSVDDSWYVTFNFSMRRREKES